MTASPPCLQKVVKHPKILAANVFKRKKEGPRVRSLVESSSFWEDVQACEILLNAPAVCNAVYENGYLGVVMHYFYKLIFYKTLDTLSLAHRRTCVKVSVFRKLCILFVDRCCALEANQTQCARLLLCHGSEIARRTCGAAGAQLRVQKSTPLFSDQLKTVSFKFQLKLKTFNAKCYTASVFADACWKSTSSGISTKTGH